MLKHRCPWCGETLPLEFPIKQLIWTLHQPNLCPKCKNPYTSYRNFRSGMILLPLLIVCSIIYIIIIPHRIFAGQQFLVTIQCILLVVLLIGTYRTPFEKNMKKADKLHTEPKQQTAVTITWESHEKDGLLLPRFRMQNGEIFPACFLDAQGNSISTAFCVTLENLKWQNAHHCTCNISLVLDDAPIETLFLPGNQLFLYHNYRKIAKGIIVAF